MSKTIPHKLLLRTRSTRPKASLTAFFRYLPNENTVGVVQDHLCWDLRRLECKKEAKRIIPRHVFIITMIEPLEGTI